MAPCLPPEGKLRWQCPGKWSLVKSKEPVRSFLVHKMGVRQYQRAKNEKSCTWPVSLLLLFRALGLGHSKRWTLRSPAPSLPSLLRPASSCSSGCGESKQGESRAGWVTAAQRQAL